MRKRWGTPREGGNGSTNEQHAQGRRCGAAVLPQELDLCCPAVNVACTAELAWRRRWHADTMPFPGQLIAPAHAVKTLKPPKQKSLNPPKP